jgi:hypothetical protein
METKALSRRATLAGVLSLAPAAAVAAVPIASSASIKVDPIFAAIEKHREAFKAFHDACGAHSARDEEWFAQRKDPRDDKPAAVLDAEEHELAMSDQHDEARAALLTTVPTTLAGALAVIRYVTSYGVGTNEILERGGSHNLFGDRADEFTFLTKIGDAIEATLGGGAAAAT